MTVTSTDVNNSNHTTPIPTPLTFVASLLVQTPPPPGEDSASFSLSSQSLPEWITFTVATSLVLYLVSYTWFLPQGPHLGDAYLSSIQSITGPSPAPTIAGMLTFFAIVHSGLASLRTYSESIIGPRAHRVIFALLSLPLSLSALSYFVNHAHDGPAHWDLRDLPFVHPLIWSLNALSFLLLYPSTFNLLEISAVQPPSVHLWDTGVIRITRHPQAVGQVMWCLGHCMWTGTDTALAASGVLVAHHAFSVWNGDRRMEER